ncbi:MAG: glycosyltransferase [Candidatus Omnitrophica bacterium]|nr:glycosyltransferase [Candidatus Omnitrophota bacterium]
MRRYNVVHIVEDLKIGGIERIVATLSQYSNKDKFNIHVICLTKFGATGEELAKIGVSIEALGMGYHLTLPVLCKLFKKLKQKNTDIVHCHGYPGATVGRIAAILARIPIIIYHTHNTFEDYTKRMVVTEKLLNIFTDRILYCSNAALNSARQRYAVDSKKADVIYNGVNKLRINEMFDFVEVKREFNIPANTKVVGCIASLVLRKGQRYLIDAAKILRDSLPADKMPKIMLVGDGSSRGDLERQVERLNLRADVIFTGARMDVARLLEAMDVVVLSSNIREGLGICLIEAMAKGKPVIGTNVGGIPEVIKDGINGLIIPSEDSSKMAESIKIIIEDGALARKMGEAGRKIFEEKFTHEHMMGQIERIYDDLIKNKIGKKGRKEKISVALIVKNEEEHIRQCLESLYWADEIVVLDGFSTDRTLEIVRQYTDKIYQKKFEGFPREREYLLTKTANDWVFMVDADMVIQPPLIKEIEEEFSKSLQRYSACTFRFLNIYLGKEIRHCGWYDPNNPRLFDKRKGKYDTKMKYIDSFIPDGRVKVMRNDILHYGFKSINEHFARVNRYSELNAEDLNTKGIRINNFNIAYYFILKPILVFLYKYVYKKGFLDGIVGLILCLMAAITYRVSYFKLWELQKKKVL